MQYFVTQHTPFGWAFVRSGVQIRPVTENN